MSTIKTNQVLNLDGDRIGSVVVDSIANMKNLNTEIEANATVELLGYYSKGDGGGGTFYWDSTSIEDDNGGTIIEATGVVDGRWIRNYSGAVNVKWFGAKGDYNGTTGTNDSAAIKNAMLYGRDILITDGDYYVPDGIAFSTQTNISVTAHNSAKIISPFKYVFLFSGSSNISFNGVHIDQSVATEADHDVSLYARGGLLFSNCDKISVNSSKFFTGYNPAVNLINTSNSTISNNNMYNSLNTIALTNNSLSSTGVYLVDSCENNTIDGNIIFNQGYGVSLQSVGDDTNTDNNIVSNNIITNSYVYGIMGYIVNRQTSSSTCDYNTFSDNLIDTVYGNVINEGSGNLDFGAGLYLQNARNNSVICNTIKNTNINTTGGTLNPSSISLSYALNTTVTGNSIIDFKGNGLNIFNSDSANSGIVVSGNKFINTADKLHMQIVGSGVSVVGNSFTYDNVAVGAGYAILNSEKYAGVSYNDITISGNIFNNMSGVSINNAKDTIVSSNTINNCLFGIKFNGVSDGLVNNNIITPHTGDGKGLFINCSGHTKPTIVNGNSVYSNNTPANYFVTESITNSNYMKYGTRVYGDYAEQVDLPASATTFNGSNTKCILFESATSTGNISTIEKSSMIDLRYNTIYLFTQAFTKTIVHTGTGVGGISLLGGVNAVIPARSVLQLTFQNSGSYWMETSRNF